MNAKTTPRDYTMKYLGTNPLEKLRDGEPYFFLRAQDLLAVDAIRAYGDLVKKASDDIRKAGNDAKADELFKQALGIIHVCDIFMDWQEANQQFTKLPD